MAVQFQYKVALRRAMMDFDNSLLHEYAKLTEYTKLCIPYLCKRSNLSEDEAVKRLCRPSVLNEHWARDRRAWVDDYHLSQPISKPRHDPAKPKPLNYNLSQSRADPLGLKPIRICTLCANISTLLTLARLIKNYENIGIEVKCSFTSPMEYWSSPSLLEDVDIFVTEISAPIICGIDACDKYELAFPIHFTEEGVIYKNKDSYYKNTIINPRGGKPIVTIGTSSLSHARIIYGKNTSEGFDSLNSTGEWQNIVGNLNDNDKLFVWEPWLSMFNEIYEDSGLYTHRDGGFIMGMFVNSETLLDLDRQPKILYFFDAFIQQWRKTYKDYNLLSEEDIYELYEFKDWHTTFFNTIFSSVGHLESVLPTEKRDRIIMIFDEKIKKHVTDSNELEYINTVEKHIIKGVNKLPENRLILALSYLERLAKDRRKHPNQKAHEFLRCIQEKLPKSRFNWISNMIAQHQIRIFA